MRRVERIEKKRQYNRSREKNEQHFNIHSTRDEAQQSFAIVKQKVYGVN